MNIFSTTYKNLISYRLCTIKIISNSSTEQHHVQKVIKLFILNELSYPYHLDESILSFKAVGWYFFIFIQIEHSVYMGESSKYPKS